MARKSQSVRLQEAEDLLAKYIAAGIGCEYNTSARFINDMISKMKIKKYPTKKQRAWLDTLIADGVPAPKGDIDYIKKIDDALLVENIEHNHVLRDFKGRLVLGYDLSEKQKIWCDLLIKKASDIKDGTHWIPNKKLTERLKLAISVKKCYTSYYWQSHQGFAKSLEKVESWLSGDRQYIDETACLRALKAVSGRLQLLEKPKFKAGDIAYNKQNDVCIILEGPKPTTAGLEYKVLVSGEIRILTSLNKRRT
jgi:hypothetical protein